MNQGKSLKLETKREVFLDWLCTPRAQRRPRTQTGLARLLEVHVITLATWKQSPQFWTDFVRRLCRRVTHQIPEVTSDLIAQVKGSHMAADRLLLDTFGPKAWLGVDSEKNYNPISFEQILKASTEDFCVPTWKEEELAEAAAREAERAASFEDGAGI